MTALVRSSKLALAGLVAVCMLAVAPAASAQQELGQIDVSPTPPTQTAGIPSEATSVPDVVFHHVVDAREIEFENPITGATAVFHLPQWVVGGFDLSPTKHTAVMWLSAALIVLVLSLAARKRSLVPSGFYSVVEVFVKFIRDELAVKNIGKAHADHYVPYLCTAFFFILTMNLLGLVPLSATATGNIAVTGGLALATFGVTLYAGMKGQGVVGFWAHIVPSGVPLWLYPIMIPVEILGLFTKPFALAVRLFANMAAGHIVIGFLLALIFLLPAVGALVAPISVAFAAGIYLLKLFVALLQAYIFTMLSALFIGMASHPH